MLLLCWPISVVTTGTASGGVTRTHPQALEWRLPQVGRR
jgi:hypothetical protein